MEKEMQLRSELVLVLRKFSVEELNDAKVGPNLSAYDLFENICCYLAIEPDDALDPTFEWR